MLGDRVVVSVDAPGYEPLMAERGVNADLGDFDLKRAPQVTGVVKDERGPVADAVVTCDPCDQSVLTDQEGRFSLGRPAWQREFSVIARKGRRSATQTLTDKDQAPLELTLKAGVKVYGQAYLPTGVPAAGLEIVGVHTDRGETTSAVTNSDGSYSLDAMPGLYRFMLAMPPGLATTTEPASLIAEVTGTEQRVDFGPVPGLSSLTVELTPQPGRALWLVRGDVSAVSNPPMELLRSKWAQLIYQPFQAQVTLGGLAPGRYTLVWASFHATMPAGAQVVPVDVPTSGIVKLQ